MKKLSLVYIYLISLGLIFTIISFLVFLTKGKNDFFLSKKLKIGAALLTLSFILNGNTYANSEKRPPERLCYMPVEWEPPKPPPLSAKLFYNNINLNVLDELKGEITDGHFSLNGKDHYIFNIINNLGIVVQNGKLNLLNTDSKYTHSFSIKLKKHIPTGVYIINLFSSGKQQKVKPFYSRDLHIVTRELIKKKENNFQQYEF